MAGEFQAMDSFSSAVRFFFNIIPSWSDLRQIHLAISTEQHVECRDSVVIVGGGVIGLSTAYYLATAAKSQGSPRCISVIESSTTVFPAASGGSTGVLGDYGFAPEAQALGLLSWQLHKQLAKVYDGQKNWGFSDIMIHHLHNKSEGQTPQRSHEDAIKLPSWFRDSEDYRADLAYGPDHAARIDPLQFGHFLLKRCEEMGVRVYTDARVTDINIDRQDKAEILSVEILERAWRTSLPCQNLVICAGPWSQRVFDSLFPEASYKIPMDSYTKAGNHFRMKTPKWLPEDDQNGTAQLYLQGVLGHTLDISSLLGGTLYVGGYGAEPEELPALATDIYPQPKIIEEMKELAEKVLNIPKDESLDIFDVGRCFRPFVKQRRPIIAKVPVNHIFPSKSDTWKSGGLFVSTGHGSDGITLGPGSGLTLSELIMGVPTSADISRLKL